MRILIRSLPVFVQLGSSSRAKNGSVLKRCCRNIRSLSSSILSPNRKRLLDIARGYDIIQEEIEENDENGSLSTSTNSTESNNSTTSSKNETSKRILRCFPLTLNNIPSIEQPITTPNDFHELLCQKIKSAKNRVYLASLYIGPGAATTTTTKTITTSTTGTTGDRINESKERELLESLRYISSVRNESSYTSSCEKVKIKILLDYNRALRPIPVPSSHDKNSTNRDSSKQATITSASACYQAICSDKDQSIPSSKNDANVYLLSVLSDKLRYMLPNPFNEIAGVFHVKCYIVDNEMILSGANLSEEYFTNRVDRYLWIRDTTISSSSSEEESTKSMDKKKKSDTIGLVQCYADIIDALCDHSEQYEETHSILSPTGKDGRDLLPAFQNNTDLGRQRTSRTQLLEKLTDILTEPSTKSKLVNENNTNTDYGNEKDEIIAFAVPTFQFPKDYFRSLRIQSNPIPSDVNVITNMIRFNSSMNQKICDVTDRTSTLPNQRTLYYPSGVRLATAYLNPSKRLIQSLKNTTIIHLLSAGKLSHGFKMTQNENDHDTIPSNIKKRSETKSNKNQHQGKKWIPAIFDAFARKALFTLHEQQHWQYNSSTRHHIHSNKCKDGRRHDLENIHLWYYQRQNWTFHAKGMWLTQHQKSQNNNNNNNNNENANDLLLRHPKDLCAVVTGSGNYGYRSEFLDMESNLLMIFPDYPNVENSDHLSPSYSDKKLNHDHQRYHQSSNNNTTKCIGFFQNEWNNLCQHAESYENQDTMPLNRFIKMALPLIQKFF